MTEAPEGDEKADDAQPFWARLTALVSRKDNQEAAGTPDINPPVETSAAAAVQVGGGAACTTPSMSEELNPAAPTSPGSSALSSPRDRTFDAVSIRDAVCSAATSQRLRNIAVTDGLFEEWTVAQALSSEDIFFRDLIRVHGLGRRSALELMSLLRGLDITLTVNNLDGDREFQQRDQVQVVARQLKDARLLDVSLREAVRFFGCSVRLSNVLARADLGTIGDYLTDPSVALHRLRELQGIGRKTINEAIEKVERFITAAAGGDAAVTSLVATEDQLDTVASGPDRHLSKRAEFEMLVQGLPAKERHVLIHRFGLDGSEPQTLQEIAARTYVTRERVRQLESKGLRLLRLPAHRSTLREFLRAEHECMWSTLASGNNLITDIELRDNRRRLEPWQRLALEVAFGDIREWLTAHSTRTDSGWLRFGTDAGQIDEARGDVETLARARPLPMPVDTVARLLGLRIAEVEIAAEHSSQVSIQEGYLCSGRIGARTNRIVRLHGIARALFGGAPFDIVTLAATYRDRIPDDEVAPRMFRMQMEEAPHLFCRLFENVWFALSDDVGHRGYLPTVPLERACPLEPKFDHESIGTRIVEALSAGPRRLGDLRDQIHKAANGRIAESSIGAVLHANPCFRRIAPGIFDLCRSGSSDTGPCQFDKSLFDERQCRAYCFARYGGAPFYWYPAWDRHFEVGLVDWAIRSAEPDLLRSLLCVIEPDEWLLPETELKQWWDIKNSDAAWLIGSNRRSPLGTRFIDPTHFVATLAHLSFFGWTNWVAVNRTTDARVDIHDAADTLAILAKSGLAIAPRDWQGRHVATDRVHAVFSAICRELHECGFLSWETGKLGELWDGLARADTSISYGWVANDEFVAALGRWEADDAKSSRAFSRKSPEPIDPEPIFESSDWNGLFHTL
jgi:hypothetical protein